MFQESRSASLSTNDHYPDCIKYETLEFEEHANDSPHIPFASEYSI